MIGTRKMTRGMTKMGMIDKDDAIKAVCEACYMYKYIGEHYKECKYYPCDDINALEAIPSAEQVTSKLKNPCDSLLTEDSADAKEQKSKLESAEAVQGDGKMIPIELKKRYPHSRDEDITDAFMRGYQAHAEAVQGVSREQYQRVIDTVANLTEEISSMVKAVRCKDCRYFKKIAERSDSGLCHRDIVASAWKENDYCSRGKRKGGENE